jgi:hypothetical protein
MRTTDWMGRRKLVRKEQADERLEDEGSEHH